MPSRETDNTTIKSNLRACKRQSVSLIQLFHDSAQSASHAFHSLSRQRENLEEKERGAFISSVRISLPAEDVT
jgi:hypothetical protein